MNSKEEKDNKHPNKSQSEFSTLCPVELLFKLYKFHRSFSSWLEWTTGLFFPLLVFHILTFQHQCLNSTRCAAYRGVTSPHTFSPLQLGNLPWTRFLGTFLIGISSNKSLLHISCNPGVKVFVLSDNKQQELSTRAPPHSDHPPGSLVFLSISQVGDKLWLSLCNLE